YAQSLIRFKARQISRKRGFGDSDRDDLNQELILRLLEKASLYDAGRGASLETFADRVVNSAVRMILRDRRRLKRAPEFTALSLETSSVMVDGMPTLLSDAISADDRQRLTFSEPCDSQDLVAFGASLGSLPPDLAQVAGELMNGTIASAARRLSVSRRQIYRAVARIREHFQAATVTV